MDATGPGPLHGLVTAALILAFAGSSLAQVVCHVPGTYSAVQAAVDDPTCSIISLQSRTYAESVRIGRTVEIGAPPARAILNGRFTVVGSGIDVIVSNLTVRNGCNPSAMTVTDGSHLEVRGVLEVQRRDLEPCPEVIGGLFADGFESADTTAWSDSTP